MLLAQNGIIPPKQWEHNPKLHNNSEYTVATILLKNGIDVPK